MSESLEDKKTNGAKLSYLLIDKGTKALRKAFDKRISQSELNSRLKSKREVLEKTRGITKPQMTLLYPQNGSSPSSEEFDISLLCILFPIICDLSIPNSAEEPPSEDESLQADIGRIKYYRNKVYAHVTTTLVCNKDFQLYWTKISAVLKRLGVDATELQDLKSTDEDFYIGELKGWKETEDKLEAGLHRILNELPNLRDLITYNIIFNLLVVLLCFWILYNVIYHPASSTQSVFSTSHLPSISDTTFVGRRWLFQELEDRINSSHNHRGLVIVAEPGFGKSAIMKRLISTPNSSYFIHTNIVAHHFCKFDKEETKSLGPFVKKIVKMIAQKIKEVGRMLSHDEPIRQVMANCESQPHTCFREAMLEPLQKLRNPPKTAFIVIDALDECSEKGEGYFDSPILTFLHSQGAHLPRWMKFVFSSRNFITIIWKLSDIYVSKLHILARDKRNLDDVRIFAENTLKLHPGFKETKLHRYIASLCQHAQGNFLFIEMVLEFLKDNPQRLYDEALFPTTEQCGLERLYALSFSERYKEKDFAEMQPMLEVLLASGSPLKVDDLESILNFPNNVLNADSFEKVRNKMKPYLMDSGDGTVRFYHKSFSDWLMKQTKGANGLFIKTSRGHFLIAEYLFQSRYVTEKPNLGELFKLSIHILHAGMKKPQIDRLLTFNVTQIRGGYPKQTILHKLANVEGTTRIFEVFIQQFNSVDIQDEYGDPPSFYAARKGNIDNLMVLIANGADVNYVNHKSEQYLSPHNVGRVMTRLIFIAMEKNTHMANLLLDEGAKIDIADKMGQTTVHIAAKNGHTELVRTFMHKGAKADIIALHHAAAMNHTETVEYLLGTRKVRDTCLSCKPGNVSFCYKRQNISITQFHLCYCETALHAAASRGYIQIVKLLLRNGGESLECKHISGKTPLMVAVERNDRIMVELLLKKGADLNTQCTELSLGYEYSMLPASLLYRGYRGNTVCNDGMGVIHLCARNGLWEMADYLITSWKAEYMRALDNSNFSITDYAANYNKTDFLRKFHAKYMSQVENSPLSSRFGKKEKLRKIVTCGSIESVRFFYSKKKYRYFLANYTNEGKTLLHEATILSLYRYNNLCPKTIRTSVEMDITANCIFRMKQSYQCFQSYTQRRIEYYERLKIIKFLTKLERSIDTRDAVGRTPLHYAAYYAFAGAVRHLVREGSDWRIKDKDGKTPLILALEKASDQSSNFSTIISYCQFTNNSRNFFQSCKSTAFDYTASYLIRAHNSSLKTCSNETKFILKTAIRKKLYLSLYSLFEIGIKVNCGDGLKTHLNVALRGIGHAQEINEVFKIFQINVSENCGAPFVESEIHMMAYLATFGNFFKPSYINVSFPLQRLVQHHPKGFKLLDECYDKEGYLPIHRAVQGGNVDAVKWFQELGVDMSKKTKTGLTTLDVWISVLVSNKISDKRVIQSLTNRNSFATKHIHTLVLKAFVTNYFRSSAWILPSWCKNEPTDLSPVQAATSLAMEIYFDIMKTFASVTNRLPLRCRNKHNIQFTYFIHLYNLKYQLCIRTDDLPVKYPDREAEYHMIYNRFYNTPDVDTLSTFKFQGLFQCTGIDDFLPDRKTLVKEIDRCNETCLTFVITASRQFLSIHPHVSVDSLPNEDISNHDFYFFDAHIGEIRYHALKMFFNITAKLWRQVSKAYECSYRCRCDEAKLQLLKHFTSEPRRYIMVGKFIPERMGWTDTSYSSHVQYRWPFRFLLSKILRTDKAYDYLAIIKYILEFS